MQDAFKNVLEFTRDGMLRIRQSDLTILTANQGIMEILDLDGEPGMIEGRVFADLVTYDSDVTQQRKDLARKGMIRRQEIHFRTQSGKDRWIVYDASILDDPEMGEEIIEVFVRDITTRKEAEEALRQSEQRYRSLLEAMPDLMFEIDREGVFLDYHAADSGLLAATPEVFLGKKCDEVLPPQVSDLIHEYISKAVETGTVQVFEYPLELGGEFHFFEARLLTKGDDTFLCIIREITERVQAENKLRESEERFRDVTFSMGDWVWEVDADGVYSYCSRQVEDILGYPPAEILGKTPFDLMTPAEAERVQGIFSEIVGSKAPIKDLENWNLTRDGATVCLLTRHYDFQVTTADLPAYRGLA